MSGSAVSGASEMIKRSATFLHRLTALITLWTFAFTTLAPSHGALSQARERFVFTSYTYDEVGNQLTQTDAKNHTTSYTYDNLGRRKTRKLPGNQIESVLYNDVGNMEFRTDFNGTVSQYAYDNLNRLLTRTVTSAAPGVVAANVAFTYTVNGQRETMTDASGVTTYHYDARNRLDTKATPQGTLGYTYNEVGSVTHIASSNADGTSVTYRYDDLNRLDQVEEGVGEITQYAYDEVGNLQSFATPNGVTHGYTYNALNRLTTLNVNTVAATLASYHYTQLRTGHRSSAQESGIGVPPVNSATTRSVKYQYDALYRLTREQITANVGASGVADYDLDAVGNRESRTSTVAGLSQQTFTHDANDRLDSDTYDANGNTKVGQSTLNATGAETPASTVNDVYDSENRLISRTGPNGTVTIIYDGDGNKVRETHNGTTTAYLIDTQNLTGYAQVVEELVNGNVVRTYTYGHDLLNQDQRISGTNWQATWFGYDGHGSVRQLTDGVGNVTDRYDYDAFGVLLHSQGTTFNRYRYCGEQYDDALGLYYLRARFMNASNGRFWSMDSYEGNGADPQSLHKYLYANADPVNGWDPSGNFTLLDVQAATAIATTLSSMQTDTGFGIMAQIESGTGFQSLAVGAAFVFGGHILKYAWNAIRPSSLAKIVRAVPGGTAALRGLSVRVGRLVSIYDELKGVLPSGYQANHLSQNAVFTRIPKGEGLAVPLEGSILRASSEHWSFHSTLETFWDSFRKGSATRRAGHRFGEMPTVSEYYSRVLPDALMNAGFDPHAAWQLADAAYEQARHFGYSPLDKLPIPGITNLAR